MKLRRLLPVLMGGGLSLGGYIKSLAPIAYWPLNETSGTTAANSGSLGSAADGTYVGPTLAQMAAPGGGLAPLFDGVNNYVNFAAGAIESLNTAFDGTLGSVIWWEKVYNIDVWADGTIRVSLSLGATYAGNMINPYKNSTSNSYYYRYAANGTAEALSYTPTSPIGWVLRSITWSDADDQVKFFGNGVQVGTTQTGIGTWAGALVATYTAIGAQTNSGTSPYYGYLSHVAVYDKVLTAEEIEAIYAAGSGVTGV